MRNSLLLMVGLIVFSWCSLQEEKIISQVCFEDNCFQVEIADTDATRQQWLMFREELGTQSGMLFVFESSYPHGFWMKNTLIPLDMIWIDEQMKIVDIQTALPCVADPCPSFIPNGNATYVLEVNAGLWEQLWLKKWDIWSMK